MGYATQHVPWERMDPFHLMGVKPAALAQHNPDAPPSLERSAGPPLLAGEVKPWHPDSPLFWFGVIAAVTLGAVAGSTSVRVGPLRASVSAGQT